MSEAVRMWLTPMPFGDDGGLSIVLGIDVAGDPGERLVADLLGYGHEGEEGVFYLLPDDLWARSEWIGSQLSVRLLARSELIGRHLDGHGPEAGALLDGELVDGRVTLVHRQIGTESGAVPEKLPVLVIDHDGPAGLAELLASVRAGDAGVATIGSV